ncbi:hypothetical protein [Metabacillus malikii]|uniref:Uncharacterized protein n=1 Tax=Metabacillus malikii TaxID=1504265 RepID=A0ABT9Z9N9_9BACI|nr:hypothetical protein [Metabacillus malikii]MDQ0228961.1 hypothetical protein [Metabacillus malikii]
MRKQPNYELDEHIENALAQNFLANESTLSHSGNSDVDIDILIDTKPIAFAMLYSLLASKQLTQNEFEEAVKRLDSLGKRKLSNQVINTDNDLAKVKLYEKNKRRR